MCRSFEPPSSIDKPIYGQAPFLYFFGKYYPNEIQDKYTKTHKESYFIKITLQVFYKQHFYQHHGNSLIENSLRYPKELKNKHDCMGSKHLKVKDIE